MRFSRTRPNADREINITCGVYSYYYDVVRSSCSATYYYYNTMMFILTWTSPMVNSTATNDTAIVVVR